VRFQTLVVNMLMAPFMLNEKLTRLDMIATSIIFFGTVLSIIFGSKESAEYTVSERKWSRRHLCYRGVADVVCVSPPAVTQMYWRAPFVMYMIILIISVAYSFHKLNEIQ
jgi:hypothetical protein